MTRRVSLKSHLPFSIAILAFLLHLPNHPAYGFFRDEFLFLAGAEHLSWGYVDHPPLIAWLAWLVRQTLGQGLLAYRLVPALAAAAKVVLTILLTRELGGGAWAATIAALCVVAAPVYLGIDAMFTMNSLEPVFWMGSVYVLLIVLRQNNPRWLLALGALTGLGMHNKHSALFFAAALAAGLLLSPHRHWLLNRWMWIAAVVAVVIVLPQAVWQWQHGLPMLETLRNVQRTGKNVVLGPGAFIAQQVFIMNPASALVWLPGLVWGLQRRWRWIGATYLVLLALMIVLKGKNYYLAPIYPLLFAAGGIVWEQRPRWARILVCIPIVLIGILAAPTVLPLLAPEQVVQYQQAVGVEPPRTEVSHTSPLPQHLADRIGWPEMVSTVAQVYHGLPPQDREKAYIFAENYGQAGAIDYFGPRHGLPKVISGHQTYWFWGPRGYDGSVLIALGSRDRRNLDRLFTSVEESLSVNHPWSMPSEHYRIYICRGLRIPVSELWPRTKFWN